MIYDFGLTEEMRDMLVLLVGRNLVSCLTTDSDERCWGSFATFALRFADEDVEFSTRELVHIKDWFDETNTVEMFRRPDRNVWSKSTIWVRERQADGRVKKVKRPTTYEIPVGRVVDGITVAIERLSRDASKSKFGGETGSVDFIRAIVLHFGEDALVFDKGKMSWSDIWNVKWCKRNGIDFDCGIIDPEQPEYTTSVRIEHFGRT